MPRALWYAGGREARLDTASLGTGIELEACFSGVSRGTERLLWTGSVPESEYERMRGPHQEGHLPGPVKYGYAMVARDSRGRHGFVLHPHQDRFCVPESAFHRLPDGVPPERAVLTPNVETALNAVWDGQVQPGDRVLVVGAGVVGSLIGWICGQIPGADVTLIDPLDRSGVAEVLGVRFAQRCDFDDHDVVFHTSATSEGLSDALDAVGVEGTLVEVSWYGDRPVRIALGGGFHVRRLTVRSSQVGRLPPSRAPRWSYARRLGVALGMLADPALDVLFDSEGSFEDLPSDLERVFSSPTLCHRVVYPGSRS